MICLNTTTIKIYCETKNELDKFREYKNESYDEVIKKMLFIANNLKKEPELSKKTIDAIDAARKRMKAGNFVSESDAKKRLGF